MQLNPEFRLAPIPTQHRRYIRLNRLLHRAKTRDDNAALAAAAQEMLCEPEFAAWVSKDPTVPRTLRSAADCWMIAQRYLYLVLWGRDYQGAALLCWGSDIFDPRPRSCRLIFDAFQEASLINAMGGASSSKTYSGIAFALLDWILDPNWTTVLLVGPDRDHLKRNMFGDLVRLHDGSVIPLPGTLDTESLSCDKKRGMGFFSVALDRTPSHSAKLKGVKTKPRDTDDHPLFGRSHRVRILIDEAQQVPVNAWDMLLNAISNAESKEHFKVYCAANPSDESSRYGKNCIPPGGWGSISATQETWVSETGWTVVRLNAMLSENVRFSEYINKVCTLGINRFEIAQNWTEYEREGPVDPTLLDLFARGFTDGDIATMLQQQVIFPRLISKQKVTQIIRGAGNDDQSPEVYTQVYGMFPPHGVKTSVIKQCFVEASMGEWLYVGPTVTYFAYDAAYDGGDRPATATARYGLAGGWVDVHGQPHTLGKPQYVIQIDGVGSLHGMERTEDMAHQVLHTVKLLGNLLPECAAIDATGIGVGQYDRICEDWKLITTGVAGQRVPCLRVNYAETASQQRILDEDSVTPDLLYANTSTEIWHAAAKLIERGVVRFSRAIAKEAIDELINRRSGAISAGKSRKIRVETKAEYKARGNRSPDFADAILMVIHCIRLREAYAPRSPLSAPEEQPKPIPPELRFRPGLIPANLEDVVGGDGPEVKVDLAWLTGPGGDAPEDNGGLF